MSMRMLVAGTFVVVHAVACAPADERASEALEASQASEAQALGEVAEAPPALAGKLSSSTPFFTQCNDVEFVAGLGQVQQTWAFELSPSATFSPSVYFLDDQEVERDGRAITFSGGAGWVRFDGRLESSLTARGAFQLSGTLRFADLLSGGSGPSTPLNGATFPAGPVRVGSASSVGVVGFPDGSEGRWRLRCEAGASLDP